MREWPAFRAALEAANDVMTAAGVELRAQTEGMDYLATAAARLSKSEANQFRYKKQKVMGKLLAGGWGKGFAKAASGMVIEPDDRADFVANHTETWDLTKVQLWTEEKIKEHEWLQNFIKLLVPQHVADRTALLLDTLEQKPDWRGCMTNLEAPAMQQSDWPQLEGLMNGELPGHAPWLVAVRTYGLRLGPHAWPLPAMGCWIHVQPPAAGAVLREIFL